ncbi:MAG: DUF881 domain-containing protein [Bifidobacteriaceae bacterium]|nr:DUF881 domain-containing protein [Bifidobacteriaceae bacterium]
MAGLLFTLNARSARGSDLRDAPCLRGMLTARDRQVQDLQARQAELSQAVAELVERAAPSSGQIDPQVSLAAGGVEVAGPGLTVTLSDAAAAQDLLAQAPDTPADQLLVHQQDIDAVMNALWAGGAEAMAVQGHRIASNTAVKCVGNVILVAGRVYSPPYQVSAIGPEQAMRQRLEADALVRAYRDRAARLGLTWSVAGSDRLVIAAAAAISAPLRYARTSGSPTAQTSVQAVQPASDVQPEGNAP